VVIFWDLEEGVFVELAGQIRRMTIFRAVSDELAHDQHFLSFFLYREILLRVKCYLIQCQIKAF
jgi:hypothetical protein